MPSRFLKYDNSCLFIKRDLRRLKRLKSLKEDIYDCYKIVDGLSKESLYPPPFNAFGGLITKIECSLGTLLCFKDRVPITNPFLPPSKGARLIYTIIKEYKVFIPLLVFSADEEGKLYEINRRKIRLTKSGFGKIIREKIKSV